MNKFIIIFIFTILLKPIVPVVTFVVNYDYIAKELCENKTKPQLHCNGKCYLKKELAKAAESTHPVSQNKKQTQQETEILFLEMLYNISFKNNDLQYNPVIKNNYSNQYSHLNSDSIFHPPIHS
ncbi:hypothetical protein [Flavobacterium suncheonense]|uniref:Uncharacterized protein n=1 Tax=Flavobacterium suncheonense GH29-5 = DSM 17707 TaxID=1121899 RepID=A0A0A2MBI4_9FLAO|nr:hypothetical protein [Flavobacterium suncheonense]KGO89614.1 hypothetical protein Q764_07545 [Flavobacterium suncheonense GH29-5 = DSM 17707]